MRRCNIFSGTCSDCLNGLHAMHTRVLSATCAQISPQTLHIAYGGQHDVVRYTVDEPICGNARSQTYYIRNVGCTCKPRSNSKENTTLLDHAFGTHSG